MEHHEKQASQISQLCSNWSLHRPIYKLKPLVTDWVRGKILMRFQNMLVLNATKWAETFTQCTRRSCFAHIADGGVDPMYLPFEATVHFRPKKDPGFWSPRASPQTRASAFWINLFFVAMKRCPIAARIAASIGILPCCALNDSFTEWYERLPDLWGLS